MVEAERQPQFAGMFISGGTNKWTKTMKPPTLNGRRPIQPAKEREQQAHLLAHAGQNET
jgi:hypothetical protein